TRAGRFGLGRGSLGAHGETVRHPGGQAVSTLAAAKEGQVKRDDGRMSPAHPSPLAFQPSSFAPLRQEWRLIMALAPGLLLLMLNVTLLSLVSAELTNALNSDRYRIQWIAGSYALGF